MTPTQYEQRCAEMLRMNAHNMSAGEIERFAFGAGNRALGMMGERVLQAEGEVEQLQDELEDAQHRATIAEDDIRDLQHEVRLLERERRSS